MQRFFTPNLPLGDTHIDLLDTDHVHQLTHVLRCQVRDNFTFFDGSGVEYTYQIEELQKNSIHLVLVSTSHNTVKPRRKVHVYQALPNKWDKAELIAQKLTEIGVESLNFFPADRSQTREIPEKKRNRMLKIIVESTEQSGRPSPMSLGWVKALAHTPDGYILDLQGASTPEVLPSISEEKEISLFIGPEGGWSEREKNIFHENSVSMWSLGQNVLRLETASIGASFLALQIEKKGF